MENERDALCEDYVDEYNEIYGSDPENHVEVVEQSVTFFLCVCVWWTFGSKFKQKSFFSRMFSPPTNCINLEGGDENLKL